MFEIPMNITVDLTEEDKEKVETKVSCERCGVLIVTIVTPLKPDSESLDTFDQILGQEVRLHILGHLKYNLVRTATAFER